MPLAIAHNRSRPAQMQTVVPEPDSPWLQPTADLLARLGTRVGGLSREEAAERLAAYGRNVVANGHRRSIVVELLLRFRNPLVLLLLGAATVAELSGETRAASS